MERSQVRRNNRIKTSPPEGGEQPHGELHRTRSKDPRGLKSIPVPSCYELRDQSIVPSLAAYL